MKIIIKTTNLKLTPLLKDFIEEKLNGLEKFLNILQSEKYFNHLPERSERWRRANTLRLFKKGKPKIEVWVEIGKTTSHHKKGLIFWAEYQMRLPGKSIRVTAQSEDLKSAINEVKDELKRELKQYKNKLMSQTKRRARVFKKELHLSPQARFWRKGRIREEGT
jgi:ribosomal subunit interface protein